MSALESASTNTSVAPAWAAFGGEPLLEEHGYPELQKQLDYFSNAARDRIERAYRFATFAHDGQLRKSGEPYITHPVAVAAILASLRMDVSAVIAGLLHDTVEDTSATLEDVEREFGATVRRIVEGETKVSKLSKRAKDGIEDEQAENLRQLLVAMTKDVRIIIVKLADRLHNMRTLGSMKPEKQVRIATETLEIYAPLAHRLGMGSLKWELEDLSFQYLNPKSYQDLAQQIRLKQNERDAFVQRAIAKLREVLETDRELNRWLLRFEITGRSKHLYSIFGKMQRDAKHLEQIFDLLAIRVILEPRAVTEAELTEGATRDQVESQREKRVCYHALGVVHSIWTPIPGRFKDYIAVPKPNGYQSLHSTVISLEGQPIEVQIRTSRMHSIAEFGVAAHWLYKQGVEDGAGFENKNAGLEELRRGMNWLENLEALSSEIKDAGDFVDAVQQDLLSTRVFVFTPKGNTISLPQGATPIDMAYHIHTDIGHHAVGARVNGNIVPLSHQLDNGDRVEIMVNRGSPGPSRDWMDFAATRSARNKIRSFFRAQERSEALHHGHEILDRYLKKRGLPARKLMRTKNLEDITEKLLSSRNPDDLYMAIHSGRFTAQVVARALAPELEVQSAPVAPSAKPTLAPAASGVFIEGGLRAPIKFAQCCKPIRGDDITGYITRGRGVTIHRQDCPNAKRLRSDEADRIVSVGWDASSVSSSVVDVEVLATDRVGLLKDALDVLERLRKSALKVEANVASGEARIGLRFEVRHQSEFDIIRNALLEIRDVFDVIRQGARSDGARDSAREKIPKETSKAPRGKASSRANA
jgi:GTP diphosphokinase / guanosine-3',5'-bis(diphosphate) 3'-diphosphatase